MPNRSAQYSMYVKMVLKLKNINNASTSCYTWLRDTNTLMFIVIMLIVSYIVLMPVAATFALFPSLANSKAGPSLNHDSLVLKIALGVVVIPYIETAIFQWGVIRLLSGKLKLPIKWCILASAILFGLSHSYSYQYIIFGTLIGLVLAYSFALRDYSGGKPFLCVFMIHALHNVISALFLP